MKLTLMTLFLGVLGLVTITRSQGQSGHDHMTATCVEIPPGEKRPEFGCFRIAAVKGLTPAGRPIYWHLRTFPDRVAAEAVRSPAGVVVEEEGRIWLSEFAAKDAAPRGGEPVAVIGPLELLPAKSYEAEIAYAVLRPGDRSRVHTHPGPEAWYVTAGDQCLETPSGTQRAHAGESMFVAPSIAMELNITGTSVRRSLVVVIHDPAQPFGNPSAWKPTGACNK